jgi:hypothetical protein
VGGSAAAALLIAASAANSRVNFTASKPCARFFTLIIWNSPLGKILPEFGRVLKVGGT